MTITDHLIDVEVEKLKALMKKRRDQSKRHASVRSLSNTENEIRLQSSNVFTKVLNEKIWSGEVSQKLIDKIRIIFTDAAMLISTDDCYRRWINRNLRQLEIVCSDNGLDKFDAYLKKALGRK